MIKKQLKILSKKNSKKLQVFNSLKGIFLLKVLQLCRFAERPKEEIRVNTYYTIKPSELLFLVPSLPSDGYTVVVREIMRNHKSVRKGELPYVLQCVDREVQ